MRKILVLGAGRSAAALVHYLIGHAGEQQWRVTVADREPAQARALIGDGTAVAEAVALDAVDADARAALIAAHDLVISMLPAFMHIDVLRDCLRLRKHVITPSYVPDALWAMDAEFKAAGLIVLNEMGLDPGIDHMSAMRIIDRIRGEGGAIAAFESYCGGLVAPESDTNRWGYKFSWNPRNVVLAGQGGAARYIADGTTKYIPYHRLFRRTVAVEVPGLGRFDGYANRDSLKYRPHYGLDGIPTLRRGTLRKAGFCAGWDVLVQLGCTEDGFIMELPPDATWGDYLRAFLPAEGATGRTVGDGPLRSALAAHLGLAPDGPVMAMLDELRVFSDERIGRTGLSPAGLLQHLLEQRWALGPDDKDLVVMWHRFRYTVEGRTTELQASLAVIGTDTTHTAMARTVGLPMGMAAKLLLNGGIPERGVLLPLKPWIYGPVLDELEALGIGFAERMMGAATEGPAPAR
ncbi:MAG: saccharopine dehydrogenase C-terminal domain-containing protein [Flavobacteriales bacterium]|nr:saccharopine dehydrogenase C-terminal domain-containing protein [Flavobacteriales bacterium]